MRNSKIILAKSGLGAGTPGAELGPDALRIVLNEEFPESISAHGLTEISNDHQMRVSSNKHQDDYVEQVYQFHEKLAGEVVQAYASHDSVLVVTGDHSNANGSISGLKKAFPNSRIGVIWIDAHADLHTPYTSPSQNIHGMPLAAVCGITNEEMQRNTLTDSRKALWQSFMDCASQESSPKLAVNDLVFIDIRDLEEEEWGLLKKHNIKYFEPSDRKKLGISKLKEQALAHLQGCDLLYVSFDVDSLDPSISRGTGTPVDDGLAVSEAVELLSTFCQDERCKMLEVTEINPLLDERNVMAKTTARILNETGIL